MVSIEQITIENFEKKYPNQNKSKTILYLIEISKKFIASSCQITNNFFTQMGTIGNLNKNGDYISKYVDKEDLVTA